MSALLFTALSSVFALNVYATNVLRRSALYDARQKKWQFALIWFFPPVGAVLVLYLAKEPRATNSAPHHPTDCGLDDGDLRLDNYSSSDFGSGDAGGGGDCAGGGGGD